MFRMNARESAASAKAYYTEDARQDYYSEGQQFLGNWGGRGAARLGLAGTVERNAFIALCDNKHPETGAPLTARTNAARTVGYDLNFHCPKSISVVQAWTGDRRIIEAFRKAVNETMEELEANTRTRVRKGGQQDGDRITGNLIWAEFVHMTTRPVNGIPDPHLHAHCFTFNGTYDPVEKRWKAGQFREINRDAPYYEAAFHSRLAYHLQRIGYPIRRVEKAFEIAGVPDSIIEKFSRRTALIEKTAKELGITSAAAKDKLGALTREKKCNDLTLPELLKIWQARVTPEENVILNNIRRAQSGQSPELAPPQLNKDSIMADRPNAPETVVERHTGKPSQKLGAIGLAKLSGGTSAKPAGTMRLAEREALDRSILHNFERASVVTESNLLTHALRFSVGQTTPELIRAAIPLHPEFIFGEMAGRRYVTTKTVLAEELANVAWVKNSMGCYSPFVDVYQPTNTHLDQEQLMAVRHILSSRDRVTALEGKSGTGKTWLMKEALAALEAEHHRVMVMAPNAETVNDTLRRQGFPNAQTVEQLLTNEKLQDEYRNGIWWVDEAGQLSSRSMRRLFAVADGCGARIILSGDTGQHRAVERGDALRALYEHADLAPATISTIRRQTGAYREAVELLARGHISEGFAKLDAMGAIHEIPFAERYKALAESYVRALDEGARPLVVSPTHAEGRMVTDEVRAKLRADGQLGAETPISILKRIDLSEAERGDWRSYRPGWVLELTRATPGSPTGSRLVVDSIDQESGHVYVKKSDGSTRYWNLQEYADRFLVFQFDTLTLAEGDRVRVTKNGKAEYGGFKVSNSSLHTFQGMDEHGDLKFEKGLVLSQDFAHLAYGYCTTSYAAQGKTVDQVIVAESAESFGAANRQQFYVSTSRGKRRLEIYTNNKTELLEAVQATSLRPSAMDLARMKNSEEPTPMNYHDESKQVPAMPEPKPLWQLIVAQTPAATQPTASPQWTLEEAQKAMLIEPHERQEIAQLPELENPTLEEPEQHIQMLP